MAAPVLPEPAVPAHSRLPALIALGWLGVVGALWLGRYNGWLAPVHAVSLLESSLPFLGPGPHWREYALERLWDLAVVGIALAACFYTGAMVVRRLVAERDLLVSLFAVAIGFWLLAVVVLVLGSVRILFVPAALALALLYFAGTGRDMRWRLAASADRLGAWGGLMVAVAAVAIVLALPGALVPPFEYDALEYHLGGPAEYLQAGRIVFLPHNFYTNLPQLTEMSYLLALVCRSVTAANLIHWGTGLLTLVAVYAVGARLWNRRVGATAAALLAALPFTQDLAQTARIDLATTFFAVLALGGLLLWRRTESMLPGAGPIPTWHHGYFWLAALAAGAAVATKWTAIPVVLAPALVVVAATTRSVRRTILFGLVALLGVTPWLIKNALLAHNPVYPLLYQWFPHPFWSAEQAAVFARRHYPSFDLAGWWQLFERPWHYAFAEPLALPLLLAAAPLGLLGAAAAKRAGRWPRSDRDWLLVLLAVAFAGWFLTSFRPWRFFYPALPLAALLGAHGLARLGVVSRGMQILARAGILTLMCCGLCLMLAVALLDAGDYKRSPPRMSFVQYNLGRMAPDEFLREMGGGMYAPIVWMNENLPADARILYLGEARVYHARHPVLWATAFDRHPLSEIAAGVTMPAELRGRFWVRGITHIYINYREWDRLRQGYGYLANLDQQLLTDFLDRYGRVVFEHGPTVVYELTDGPAREQRPAGERSGSPSARPAVEEPSPTR